MSRLKVYMMCVLVVGIGIGCATTTVVVAPPEVMEVEPMVSIGQSVVYFEEDSAMLSDDAKHTLRALSDSVLQNMATVDSVHIVGHVALAGTKSGRSRISRERAENVMDYLVSSGVPESFINPEARGAADPAATNDTEEGRTLNRRTEITVRQK